MSEDENTFSDAERIENDEEHIEVDEKHADLKPLLLSDNENLAVRPMIITGVEPYGITNCDHSFDWTLATDGNHNAFLDFEVEGNSEKYLVFNMIDGRSKNKAQFVFGRPAAAALRHKWNEYGDTSGWHIIPYYMSDLPVIDNNQTFTNNITGTGGGGSTLRLWAGGGYISAPFDFVINSWSISVNSAVASRTFDVIVEQSRGQYTKRNSLTRTITYLTYPRVTSFANNAVVSLSSELKVGGVFGAPGRIIQLANGEGVVEFGRDTAKDDGSWEVKFNPKPHVPGGGTLGLGIRHIDSGNAAWTLRAVFLVAPPKITAPASVVDINTRITGTGHTGITGHLVDVFRDSSAGEIGSGWVNQSTGEWYADVVLPVGKVGITAWQRYSGVESERVAPVYFNVRPPRFGAITVSYEDGKTILSGTRYNNTRIQIHNNGDVTNPQFTVPVGSGNWRVEVSATYLPGNYGYAVKQSVTDGGSGWIDSDWNTVQSVEVKPRKLTLNTPSLNGQKPTFTGAGGFVWGSGGNQTIVQIQLNGQYNNALVPQGYLSANGTLTITAVADLPPGTYTIAGRQWVNSVWSELTQLASPLAIKPNKTLFTEPGNSSGQRPQFTLTVWPLAVVKLTDERGVLIKEHTADANGIWRHTADKEWDPGSYKINATQTFGGLTSDLATHTFTIKTPVALITPPPNNEVSPRPVITGINGWVGSWVVIYSAVGTRPELGRGEVKPDRSWSASLAKQPLGPLSIFTVQVFNTHTSDDGARLDLSVVVPVPKFDPIPPSPGRMINLTGAGFFGATIEIRRKGVPTPLAKDIEVGQDHTWMTQLTLDVGPTILVAIHRYETQYTSKESEDCSLTVVPNVPVIETPDVNEWTPRMPTFTGSGFGGDAIYVRQHNSEVLLATAQVLDDGTWSIRSEQPLSPNPDNKYTITAEQVFGEYRSAYAPPREFQLLAEPPAILFPTTGDWVGPKPEFRGTAAANAAITVSAGFNPDEVLARTTANGQGSWAVTSSQNLSKGANWVQARSSVDGVNSEWIESDRFWVEDDTR